MNNLPFDRLFNVMTKPLIALLYTSLVILSFLFLDRPIAYYFHESSLQNVVFLTWITKLGTNYIYLGIFLFAALVCRFIYKTKQGEIGAWFLLFSLVLSNLICTLLKIALGRARPSAWFDEQLYGFYGLEFKHLFWSFPSGHTTTVFSVALGLGILFPRYTYGFLILGFCVAMSRVLLTFHYLSDVLVAMYLTLIEMGLLVYFIRTRLSSVSKNLSL